VKLTQEQENMIQDIRKNDPANWINPTSLDFAIFEAWIINKYGRGIWRIYCTE
jgi:hypothetical protein